MKIELTPQACHILFKKPFYEWQLCFGNISYNAHVKIRKGESVDNPFAAKLKEKELEVRSAAIDLGYRVHLEYEDITDVAFRAKWMIEQKEIDLDELKARIGNEAYYSVEEE